MKGRGRQIFLVHVTIFPHVRGVRNGGNQSTPIIVCHSVTFWFPGYCSFADLNGCVSSQICIVTCT